MGLGYIDTLTPQGAFLSWGPSKADAKANIWTQVVCLEGDLWEHEEGVNKSEIRGREANNVCINERVMAVRTGGSVLLWTLSEIL